MTIVIHHAVKNTPARCVSFSYFSSSGKARRRVDMNAKVVRDILNDSLGENQVLWRGCFLKKKIPPPKMTIVIHHAVKNTPAI